jgi:hypothetical protein
MQENSLSAIVRVVQSYWTLCVTLGVVVGIFMVGSGLISLNRRRQESGGLGVSVVGILVGVAFINLPWWINTWSLTFLGVHANSDPLAYSTTSTSVNSAAMRAILSIIAAVGLWGVMKGLHRFRESTYDRREFWPGVSQTIAGIFAINLSVAAQMLIPFVPAPIQSLLRLFA